MKESQIWKAKILTPVFYLIATLILFFLIAREQDFLINKTQIAGLIIAVVSYIFWIVARIQLGNSFSLLPRVTELVDTGIYSKIRHPVYLFSLLTLIGVFMFVQIKVLFFLLIPLIILQVYRMHNEEGLLISKFGSRYVNYKKSTWL